MSTQQVVPAGKGEKHCAQAHFTEKGEEINLAEEKEGTHFWIFRKKRRGLLNYRQRGRGEGGS